MTSISEPTLQILYGLLTVLMLLVSLLLFVKYYAAYYKQDVDPKVSMYVGATVVVWMLYISLLINSGFLLNLALPPRFPIFIVLPLVIGFNLFYFKFRHNKMIQSIPLEVATGIQSFRILVELLLVATFYHQIIPQQATFEGWNFDIVIGLSAPLIAFFFVRKNKNIVVLRIWNIIGICMILFVAIIIGTSIYLPSLYGSEVPLTSMQFLSHPYFYLPAVLAPLGIFFHVVSLCILNKEE